MRKIWEEKTKTQSPCGQQSCLKKSSGMRDQKRAQEKSVQLQKTDDDGGIEKKRQWCAQPNRINTLRKS
jgi:hypothetical protein